MTADRSPVRLPFPWVLLLCGLLALAGKFALSLTTYGSNDVLYWEADLRKIQTEGPLALYRDGAVPSWEGTPYADAEIFNHPPLMVHVIRAWGTLEAVSGVPFRAWLRLTSSLADFGMLWLVWQILRTKKIQVRPVMLVLLALSPVSILVSGFHGNTDPVMVFFLLLSIYAIETGRPAWVAGVAFGMAINIKIVPVVFAPLILLYLGLMRRRLVFTLAAGLVFLAGSMPYLAQDPILLIRSMFGYSPVMGSWGLPEIAYLLPGNMLSAYRTIGRPLALLLVLAASLWIHRRAPHTSLFVRCGSLAFLFLFVASGFGPQYLAWLVPWWVVLPWKSARWHYVSASAFLCLFYTVWSRGGWYIANMIENRPMPPGTVPLFFLEMGCWVSVGMVVIAYLRYFTSNQYLEPVLLSGDGNLGKCLAAVGPTRAV
ncbi:MAG TPA: glycosyltransferase 87 family protein [Bryobacteraceae bacterium]|jgi:hypothetical protein